MLKQKHKIDYYLLIGLVFDKGTLLRQFHTSDGLSSVSLIKKICFRSRFRSTATDWGLNMVDMARGAYKNILTETHSELLIKNQD